MDPIYGRAKAGRPARKYIQQLCEDTGCSPEDLPEAMNDREKWRERVRDIRASGMTWWWWWWWWWWHTYIHTYIRSSLWGACGVMVIVLGNGHEFKSSTRLIAFHIVLILLGKVQIQLLSLQPWANSRTDWLHHRLHEINLGGHLSWGH